MGEIEYSVSSYVIDGDKNWNMLATRLPESICNLIAKLKPPIVRSSDIPNWNMSTDGNFSINPAYKFLSSNDNDNTNVSPLFDQVWHWRGPTRIRAVLWKLAHGSLLTNAFITEDNWAKLFSLGLYGWLEWNITTKHIGASNTDWPTSFGVSVWSLWKDHNKLVFSRETELATHLTLKIIDTAYQIEKEIKSPLASRSVNLCRKYMHWSKPPPEFFKINTDGWYVHGQAACGGIIRNHNENFVKGFMCMLGSRNALFAELKGILIGLQIMREMQLTNVILETDSIHVINRSRIVIPQFFISNLSGSIIRINRIHREANTCADARCY
ncbi:uncharacterized protein LOC123886131 [Trifolium pratense]|uniref:uncharacterized protein LOC123886131 n=1 Tax=Trifolium pratense TaxID=57577 RepID=UPI001E693231|nr:uncharacterized protein LOC123886131 [Trifolium pratense]